MTGGNRILTCGVQILTASNLFINYFGEQTL